MIFPDAEDIRKAIRDQVPDGYKADVLWEQVRQYGQGRYWQGYNDARGEESTDQYGRE